MILLYIFNAASAKAFSIECTVLNFIVATCVWIALLVFALRFSGSPYRSLAYKLKMRKLTLVIVIWCIARYCRGISGAFESKCYTFVLQSLTIEMNDSLAPPVLCILIFVIEEIIPMLIVLDWSFMEIFVISGEFTPNRRVVGGYDILKSYEFHEQLSL